MLATMVGGALWVMFPRLDLERRLTSSTSDSGLSYVYLSNLLRSDPENPRLRALMAQHEAKEEAQRLAREAAEARIAEMQNSTPLTLWNASMDEYHAIDVADTERRNAARAELVAQLQALLKEDLPPGALPRLAGQAFQLEERALGIRLYRQMAQNSAVPDEASQLYRRAAREALAMSAHAEAADLFLAARRMTKDPAQAKGRCFWMPSPPCRPQASLLRRWPWRNAKCRAWKTTPKYCERSLTLHGRLASRPLPSST
jgi:hypothetical protein